MKNLEKLNKEIRKVQTLKACGFDCSKELDRLLMKRDNQTKGVK